MGQFWSPTAVLGDPAYNNKKFFQYLLSLIIKFNPIQPRRHNKNVLYSKHGVIGSIFLRMKRDDATCPKLASVQAVRISNDLYGSGVPSAFEMVKGS